MRLLYSIGVADISRGSEREREREREREIWSVVEGGSCVK
ncbi:unnamed protein product [Pylaiella littoralis]